MNDERTTRSDQSIPTLLMVSLAGVLVAVVGVIAIGQTSVTAALVAGIAVVLAGTAAVTMAIGRQLDDEDGHGSRAAPERKRSDVA